MNTPQSILHSFFGLRDFRPGQEEVIDAILTTGKVVTVMPTGGGKSLCYQIPALLSPGFTIVISPLIALMKDQVDALNKNGTVAAYINSSIEQYEAEAILEQVRFGNIKLLYVAPERLESLKFSERVKSLSPSLLVVDEAHCISEWGHNFRPGYRKINRFIEFIGIKKIAAFTATATPEVLEDIRKQLHLTDAAVFVRGFARNNIALQIYIGKKKNDEVVRAITRYGTPAIIYTSSRRKAEELSLHIASRKIPNECYHAGLPSARRKLVQERFIDGKNGVIVATNAFGMGIDKADVRLVVHYQIPGSVEHYYQEFGRAGRDGKESAALLLFDEADVKTQQFLISSSHPDKDLINAIYDGICNYSAVPLGSFSDKELPVNTDYLSVVCGKELSNGIVLSALGKLEEAGWIRILSEFDKKLRFKFSVDAAYLKKFIKTTKNETWRELLLYLLKRFGYAPFRDRTSFTLHSISEELGIPEDEADDILLSVSYTGLMEYEKPFSKTGVILLKPRVTTEHLNLNYKSINDGFLRAHKKLEQMTGYVFTRDCRFRYILKYFGENNPAYTCGKCDNCLKELKESDKSFDYIAQSILRMLGTIETGVKEKFLITVLSGSSKSVKFRESEFLGICSQYSPGDIFITLQSLLTEGLLKKDGDLVTITHKGLEYLIEKGLISISTTSAQYEQNLELYHSLRELRTKTAERFSQPKTFICPDDVLRTIAFSKPQGRNELLNIGGFSEKMYAKFGEDIITLIAEYLERQKSKSKGRTIPSSISETMRLIQEKYSLTEIAELRKLNQAVISLQIETILEYFPDTDISFLIPAGERDQIKEVLNKGITEMKDIKKKLPETISYPAIRIVRAKYRATYKPISDSI